jgi:hypothetical protein
MEAQRAVVEYFSDLEIALNEQKEKGTPKGDPAYSRIYAQLARSISEIGIELPEAARVCGHTGTFERLKQLIKKPVR